MHTLSSFLDLAGLRVNPLTVRLPGVLYSAHLNVLYRRLSCQVKVEIYIFLKTMHEIVLDSVGIMFTQH